VVIGCAAGNRQNANIPIGARTAMTIELPKEIRKEAIESVERYFEEHMDGRIGNIAAGELLDFFIAEIGPSIYNKAVVDVQQRLQERVMELDIVIHEEEFQYWQQQKASRRPR
jgi:uncharacterized protein (DUF2164 family)